MSDDPLAKALRSLPRERAGRSFTEEVLARLDEEPPRRGFRLAPTLAVAAVAAALAAAVALPLLVGGGDAHRQPEPGMARGPGELARLGEVEPPSPAAAPPAAPPPAVLVRHARLAQLRRQQEQLAAELAALKRLAAEPVPVIYLGGDEETDVVLDVGELARHRAEAGVRPAVYGPGSPW